MRVPSGRRRGSQRIGPEQYRVVRSGIELTRFRPDPEAKREVREEWEHPTGRDRGRGGHPPLHRKAPLELVDIVLGVLREEPSAWG
ncbi:MAG: hypothetical protein R3E97_08725 [Candidatus Eisenbacteria bacterium]